jgi:hypothetical protein
MINSINLSLNINLFISKLIELIVEYKAITIIRSIRIFSIFWYVCRVSVEFLAVQSNVALMRCDRVSHSLTNKYQYTYNQISWVEREGEREREGGRERERLQLNSMLQSESHRKCLFRAKELLCYYMIDYCDGLTALTLFTVYHIVI